MANLNKLRQVNPHWKPSKSFIEDQEAAKQLAEGIKEMVDKHQEDLDKAGAEGSKKFWPEEIKQKEMNPSRYTQKDIEQTKRSIIDKILRHFDDTLFEMVCEEMSESYLFQSSNYLTEAGYDMFEDEWFEFYHEHHGDILYQVKQEFTN